VLKASLPPRPGFLSLVRAAQKRPEPLRKRAEAPILRMLELSR
jgi:hypothetical protein